jgi:hypothetical protein
MILVGLVVGSRRGDRRPLSTVSSHHLRSGASILVMQILFGWVSTSEQYLKALSA